MRLGRRRRSRSVNRRARKMAEKMPVRMVALQSSVARAASAKQTAVVGARSRARRGGRWRESDERGDIGQRKGGSRIGPAREIGESENGSLLARGSGG